jgi:hypothetical protein
MPLEIGGCRALKAVEMRGGGLAMIAETIAEKPIPADP